MNNAPFPGKRDFVDLVQVTSLVPRVSKGQPVCKSSQHEERGGTGTVGSVRTQSGWLVLRRGDSLQRLEKGPCSGLASR